MIPSDSLPLIHSYSSVSPFLTNVHIIGIPKREKNIQTLRVPNMYKHSVLFDTEQESRHIQSTLTQIMSKQSMHIEHKISTISQQNEDLDHDISMLHMKGKIMEKLSIRIIPLIEYQEINCHIPKNLSKFYKIESIQRVSPLKLSMSLSRYTISSRKILILYISKARETI